MDKLKGKTSYDDTESREKIVTFANVVLGLNVKSNTEEKKIDLIGVDDSELGIEIERGGWRGDFWENKAYSLISNLGFPTINIPIRKEKYWTEYVVERGVTKLNPSWKKNIFIRTNCDFSQIIVIYPDVIINKSIKSQFTTGRITTGDVEHWLSFTEDNVDTYNLIENQYILKEKNEI
jgi:hypothetical protein